MKTSPARQNVSARSAANSFGPVVRCWNLRWLHESQTLKRSNLELQAAPKKVYFSRVPTTQKSTKPPPPADATDG